MFHLGWFMGSGFSVQTWALDPWAGNTGHDWMKGDLFVDLAASLERVRFDYLLVEDTSMVEDAYGPPWRPRSSTGCWRRSAIPSR